MLSKCVRPFLKRAYIPMLECMNSIATLLHQLDVWIPIRSDIPDSFLKKLSKFLKLAPVRIDPLTSSANSLSIVLVVVVVNAKEQFELSLNKGS